MGCESPLLSRLRPRTRSLLMAPVTSTQASYSLSTRGTCDVNGCDVASDKTYALLRSCAVRIDMSKSCTGCQLASVLDGFVANVRADPIQSGPPSCCLFYQCYREPPIAAAQIQDAPICPRIAKSGHESRMQTWLGGNVFRLVLSPQFSRTNASCAEDFRHTECKDPRRPVCS